MAIFLDTSHEDYHWHCAGTKVSDLNTSSIYLTEDFSPKLVDFECWKKLVDFECWKTVISRSEKSSGICILPIKSTRYRATHLCIWDFVTRNSQWEASILQKQRAKECLGVAEDVYQIETF